MDQDAAAATVRFLKERAQAFQREDAELAQRRAADQILHDAVVKFLDDCPAGRLETPDADITTCDAKRSGVAREQRATQEALEGLDEADRAADRASAEISKALRKVDSTMDWLDDLIPALGDEENLRETLSREEKRAAKARKRATDHADRQVTAAGEEKKREAAARAADEEAGRYRSEAARLVTGEAAVVVPDPAVPLDTLRQNETSAHAALERRTAQSVLADRVQSLTRQVADAEAEIARHPTDPQRHAQDLLAAPDGQEPERRARALDTAKKADRDAATSLGTAEAAVSQCRAAVTAIEQQRREPPRRTLPVRPVTATAADDLASQQESSAQAAGERLTAAETHIGRIEKDKQEITGRKEQFATVLDGLPTAAQGASAVAEFVGSVDDARVAAREARQRMTDGDSRLTQAQAALTAAIDRLRRTGGNFPKISGPVKDRVMHDPPDALGRNAAGLAIQLRLRASTLEGELAAIAKDQGILADSLAGVVRESMETLARAERGSRMGTAPGAWAGRNVLRIGFDRPYDGVLHAYAERVIDRVIQKGLKPEGMPLLKDAVREAAGPRGFTVRVLKPTEDTTPVTEDISRLAKWSGGEKLTVCVALYCTIVALRAARTGRGARPGGILLLDNPIGRASSAHLVRLQRDVAASHGVQLIYTTGVKDPAAVIQFPNVIRLDNRQGGTQGRRYIVADADGTDAGLITGVRVAHTDRRWDDPGAAGEAAP